MKVVECEVTILKNKFIYFNVFQLEIYRHVAKKLYKWILQSHPCRTILQASGRFSQIYFYALLVISLIIKYHKSSCVKPMPTLRATLCQLPQNYTSYIFNTYSH